MRVYITGTPGTGKSMLAAAIGDAFSIPVYNVGVQAQVLGYVEERDEDVDADIIAEEAVEKIARSIERKNAEYVLEGHMSHYAKPRRGEDVIMICASCPIEILKERLEERGYSEAKVRENLDAEIFEVCCVEAQERGWTVLRYDSSTETPEEFTRSLTERRH